jgi:NAD+ diphosphatase
VKAHLRARIQQHRCDNRKVRDDRHPSFTGVALDRAMALREDPERVAGLLGQPRTAAVLASGDAVLLDERSAEPKLLRVRDGLLEHGTQPILLGLDDCGAVFATDLEDLDPSARAPLTEAGRVTPLRDAGALLSRSEGGLAAYLVALLNWHRRHRFCANCGTPTDVAQAGYSRHCPRCGAVHFPRTDPVVIMLVEHDGRLLLGRRPVWPPSRYSVLAGFVSPGETLEEAVVREVYEESGIEVHDPVYVASQPWPFPSSLMLGFEAHADGGEPRARDGELEDVRWFTTEQVRAALAERGDLLLPPPISIARYLIDGWIARLDA